MSQKESEWEKNQKKILLERLDFLSDHWVKGDDRPPFSFGGWREEVANDFVAIVKNSVSQREKEIAEEVEKLLKEIPTQEELELTIRSISIAQEAVEFHAHNKAIKEVLSILKHQ